MTGNATDECNPGHVLNSSSKAPESNLNHTPASFDSQKKESVLPLPPYICLNLNFT